MRKQIEHILLHELFMTISVSEATDKILSLLDENTASVSDDLHKSGGLHDVRKWNATRSYGIKLPESSVEGALGKRTDTENKCLHCDGKGNVQREHCIDPCYWCAGKGHL